MKRKNMILCMPFIMGMSVLLSGARCSDFHELIPHGSDTDHPNNGDETDDVATETEAGTEIDSVTDTDVDADTDVGGDEFVEDHADDCVIPEMGVFDDLPETDALPNPFVTMDGVALTTKAEWTCRREELSAMFQHWEFGEKPRHPDSVAASLSGDTLTITVTDEGNTIQFNVTITGAGDVGAPKPAIINYTPFSTLGTLPAGVATITYDPLAVAAESIRGQGAFYSLYGSDHTAGQLMAWAWGVSRIIDALEITPEAGIDPARLAVTGCSRYGKGAMVAGAFDERIALTIPQESGSGGTPAWRVVSTEGTFQSIESACNERPWFTASFCQFHGLEINLPVDHHELMGMVAPRGLLILDNAIDWLGPEASYTAAIAAREIYRALDDEDGITYSEIGTNNHCALPTAQRHWVVSYLGKYLLDGEGEAGAMETTASASYDVAQWIDWTTPDLL